MLENIINQNVLAGMITIAQQTKNLNRWAVVVAKLVERSLPTPEIRGSNPNIGKLLSTNCTLNRKDENKEKEAGNGPSLQKRILTDEDE